MDNVIMEANEVLSNDITKQQGSYGLVYNMNFTFIYDTPGDENMQKGGTSTGVGFVISWQHGARGKRDGELRPATGAAVEDVLLACQARLDFLQSGPFPCDENRLALNAVSDAIKFLQLRRNSRAQKGVEGLNESA